MQLSLTTLVTILLLLILISGFFSGAEIAMMSLNRYRLKYLVKQKHANAIRANKLLLKPDKLLSVVLIGNTFANIVASTAATLIGQRLYGDLGVAVATAILTVMILIFAELTPKTLAAMKPQAVAFFSALPLTWLQILFSPIIFIITWVTTKLLTICGVSENNLHHKDALSHEELRTVVHESSGLIPHEHKSMLLSLLDLESAKIEDIMIPKSEIIGIDLENDWYDILEKLKFAQHTRLPLYRDFIENLVGMVHLRQVLNLELEGKLDLEHLLALIEPPYYVPETTPLNVQILHFQKMKRRSCFVVDEYGDLKGLVTMEDILEEVVGEFTTDISNLQQDIVMQKDGAAIIDASITLRNLNKVTGWNLQTKNGPKTLSGLIIEHLGYIPPAACCLKLSNYYIEVLKVSDNLIKSVKMKPIR